MPEDFYKYTALGNDYLVVDPVAAGFALTPRNIRLLCDRNTGIGADGVLAGPHSPYGGGHPVRIFNPDGSEAEMSGNGTRIFAKYLKDQNLIKDDTAVIAAKGGNVKVTIGNGSPSIITADMGKADFASANIPVAGPAREVVGEIVIISGRQLNMTCLSLGNPHCVILCDNPDKETASALGPLIERHQLFPNRINVQFLKVTGPDKIRIEIWERGAGYTLASGSSACAAALAAHKLGLAGGDVKVAMPGGEVRVRIDAGRAFLSGPVAGVAKGVFAPDLKKLLEQP